MREALGLVETRGLSTAILVADSMIKTANVNIIGLENTKGLGYITIKIRGDVGAVNAAVTSGKQIAIENNAFISAKVIPRPSDSIEVTFCKLSNKKENDNLKKEKSNLKKEEAPKENSMIEKNNTISIADNLEEASDKKNSNKGKVSTTEKNKIIRSRAKRVESKKKE